MLRISAEYRLDFILDDILFKSNVQLIKFNSDTLNYAINRGLALKTIKSEYKNIIDTFKCNISIIDIYQDETI